MSETLEIRLLLRLHRRAQRTLGLTPPRFGVQPNAVSLAAGGDTWHLAPLFVNHRSSNSFSFATLADWFLAKVDTSQGATGTAELWDRAHAFMASTLEKAPPGEAYLEPDLTQGWQYTNETPLVPAGLAGAGTVELCQFNDQDPNVPRGPGFAWFLDDNFSQLASARTKVAECQQRKPARIAHLDTGYDPDHLTLPVGLDRLLQHNFVEGEDPNDARDPARRGFLKNPGHGTGTLSILAGNRVDAAGRYLGGAPLASIVPIRIASSVVLFRTSALARALDYVIAPGGDPTKRVDVVSLSMGGLASLAWAEAVNRAYEAGVFMVAAAGNNFGDLPTRFIVYPARFRRVVAACGVMADGRPYHGVGKGRMQGNYGPTSKMATAMSAYTPNMPWAELGCPGIVDHDGQGTSSATPQIAAAAALWLQLHDPTYAQPWMRVEAARKALFGSAQRRDSQELAEYLGQGVLRARQALDILPFATLEQTPRDSAVFPFLRVLTGLGMTEREHPLATMLALEATQLAQRVKEIEDVLPDPDTSPELVPRDQVERFIDAVIDSGKASAALISHLKKRAVKTHIPRVWAPSPPRLDNEPGTGAAAQPAVGPVQLHPSYPHPTERHLRGYAFDPSLSLHLKTAVVNEACFHMPWEQLEPGPIGEYLEVIDHDPASGCFYAPVDLDSPDLLAQDGLPPGDGNPQFHQQMVYAVAMRTIKSFERALGRPAFWAPGPGDHEWDDSRYVRRLRLYPHAFRDANAYYSPTKVAVLFGYFPASADSTEHVPGGTVFTCLSQDIVAHETTHALLDGMHRDYRAPSNPDVLAFHEAFADLVALFQHFTLPEIVRHQILQTRGDLRTESLLGQLAWEFGRATGMRGALRSAIGRPNATTGEWEPAPVDPTAYQRTEEPHARGSILVSAVFDAFVSIYESRIADLLRLATAGSGVLPAGAISMDLADRLSAEAVKSASHVLTMCVRALDFTAPVDVTFGEYLRALITADADLVPTDEHKYRVAFVEAFRRRGIFPEEVRSLSIESLLWRPPEANPPYCKPTLGDVLSDLRRFGLDCLYTDNREELFYRARNARAALHELLLDHFRSVEGERDARVLRLVNPAARPFEVHSLRVAQRVAPNGRTLPQMIIEITQKDEEAAFEGGCTLVVDLQTFDVRYCIYKDLASQERRARHAAFKQSYGFGALWSTYFTAGDQDAIREPFALLHRVGNQGGIYV
jgi:hypothetical protein